MISTRHHEKKTCDHNIHCMLAKKVHRCMSSMKITVFLIYINANYFTGKYFINWGFFFGRIDSKSTNIIKYDGNQHLIELYFAYRNWVRPHLALFVWLVDIVWMRMNVLCIFFLFVSKLARVLYCFFMHRPA